MRFEGEFSSKKPLNEVKQFLLDASQFTKCLPGIQSYESTNDTFKAYFKLDVSQMKIPYMSTLSANINAKISGNENEIRISGNGRSAGVGIKFSIIMRLESAKDKTIVNWLAELDLGMLAKLIGNDVIRNIINNNINYIMNCMSEKL
ncbi:MAG: SRPBCC domain-containing protein [Saccharolobus sp.]